MEAKLEFSQKTVSNYIRVYNRREQFKLVSVTNLADAYRLLAGTSEERQRRNSTAKRKQPALECVLKLTLSRYQVLRLPSLNS
jgi:hypothetical protein